MLVAFFPTFCGTVCSASCCSLPLPDLSHTVFPSTDFNSYVSVSLAETTAQRKQGRMAAPIAPGLGVTPRPEVLGKPVFQYPPPQGDC
jgi:hypothetical protein